MPVHRLVKELFGEALGLKPEERGSFLEGACAGDLRLREAVEELLRVHEGAGGFLGAPTQGRASGGEGDATVEGACPTAVPANAGVPERPGAHIGRYELLEAIGEGGFGVVFMAEQREPVVRRVALKIIKLGMDTRQVIARFEAERQALAMMDHPSIARVLDAGATETGRPYFVMELVRGETITGYCDRVGLRTAQRLELFVQVCHAVQHAHTKGIIHRDLKPSNVLVTEIDRRAVPKVIDFGIAKATAARLTEKTLFTEFRQFVGTPEYMSPEQAALSGVDIDSRSDVYSLGVLLYELLTGAPPLDGARLRSAAWDEMLRMIREEEPPRPSTRLSSMKEAIASIAAQRRVEPARLAKLVRGDLDWIAMKCLEKDRARRYETASALAADVQCHLTGEPVEAAPPSRLYVASKFVRRHRRGVASAAMVVLVLLVALGVCARLTVRAVRAEQEAWNRLQESEALRRAERSARERAEQFADVAESLLRANLDWMRRDGAARGSREFDAQLYRLALLLDRRGRPEEAAVLLRGLLARATLGPRAGLPSEPVLQRELERVLARAASPADAQTDPELALQRAYRRLEDLHIFAVDIAEAARADADLTPELRERVASLALAKGDSADRLSDVAWRLVFKGPVEPGVGRRALRAAERAVEADPGAARYQNTLGAALFRLGRFEEALGALERSSKLLISLYGRDHVANPLFRAMTLAKMGRADEARKLFLETKRALASGELDMGDFADALVAEAEELIDGKGLGDQRSEPAGAGP